MPLSAGPAAFGRDRWRLLPFDRWLRLAIVLALLPTILQAPTVLSQVRPGASLTVIQGSVSVTQSDGVKIYPAGTGLTLSIGDMVGTLDRTRAYVTFFSGTEIELGSNTTIVIRRLDRDLLDQANVTVEHLSGMTVIRVPLDAGPNPGVRVLGNNTVAVIHNGEVGHGVDPTTNNTTVGCVDGEFRCSRDSGSFATTFPDPKTALIGQSALVVTGDGERIALGVARGTSIWEVMAEGGALRHEPGNGGQSDPEKDKKDRDKEKKEDDVKPNQPQTQPIVATSTRIPIPGATFTPTLTPTATFTPTATPTPTFTPVPTPTPLTGAPCGTTQSQVGGNGTFAFAHDLVKTSGVVHLEWNAFGEPDQFEILYQGVVLFSTFDPVTNKPFVAGVGSADVPFGPGPTGVIVIRVTTSENSIVWQYRVSCI